MSSPMLVCYAASIPQKTVARLSRAMSNATLNDARLLRNTLRYLDQHRKIPLCYRRQNNAVEQLLHEINMQDPNIFIVNGAEDLDMLWMHDSNFASPKSVSGYCSLRSRKITSTRSGLRKGS